MIVYLNAEKVGFLKQDDGGRLQFGYDRQWLDTPGAIPISRTLPLQPEVFWGKKVRPFFAGILPEEGPRKKIAAILGISERNDFAMLEKIGGECAGAVSLLPEGVAPVMPGKTMLHRLTDAELAEVVAELPSRPLLVGRAGLRLSLAGAQDKLPIVLHDGGIALPLGDTPSTHILKPEPDRFPGLVANEVFCMKLAGEVGLNVPEVEGRVIGGKACILVRRYDRVMADGGALKRIHQEDFCQALGFPPERKYQEEGGPALRDCISLLRIWSSTPVLDIRDFIDGLIFNMIIGNADAHAKNYSMLYSSKGERRLAPFYDLVCTLFWPEVSMTLSMKIGNGKELKNFAPDNWRKMAKENNLGWPMIRGRIETLTGKILDRVGHVGEQIRDLNESLVKRIEGIVVSRAEKTVEE